MPLVLRQCSNGGVRLLFHPRWKVEVEVQVEVREAMPWWMGVTTT